MKFWVLIHFIFAVCVAWAPRAWSAGNSELQNQFGNFEIRVIRPKYFQKSVRLEIGANVGAVMNKSFTYTYLPAAKLGLHMTEWLELFGEGAAGITINKSDCTELGTKFNIEPIVDEVELLAGGGVALTPIYGKYQLSSGEVVYFDWFLTAGGGMANMKKREQGCKPPVKGDVVRQSTPYSKIHFNFGTGQRYFLNKTTALNWGLRFFMIPNTVDSINENVTLSFGSSYYF
jgi:outer membrane beta-barrel protein